MQTGDEHIDFDLLTKYLVGETSEAENAAVAAWIGAHEDNQTMLDELREVLEQTDAVKPVIEVDTDAAWAKMQDKMQQAAQPKVVPMAEMPSLVKGADMWYRIAAMFIGVAAVAAVFMYTGAGGSMVTLAEVSTIKGTRIDTLSDGTIVTLNENSSLAYPEVFAKNERRVILTGEAFFNVSKDASKPFIIEAGSVDVTVLGTSFNVNAYRANEDIEVVVETGRVQVANKNTGSIVLQAGDKANYSKQTGILQKVPMDDVDYQFWRLKKLVFTNTSLIEVVDILNEKYQAHLSLESTAAATCRFTATFEDDNLQTILNVLIATFNLQVEESSEGRILKGDACDGSSL